MARLPVGLIRPGPPAGAHAIAAAEASLGAPLPDLFRSFLLSFDGADLFHEAVLIAGVGEHAPLPLVDINPGTSQSNQAGARAGARPGELIFAVVLGGDRYAINAEGHVTRLRSDSDERWFAGQDFSRWLDGLVAHQRVLYGPDGEFRPEAFEPDGSEVIPVMALRQAERALRHCDDSAEWHHERGVALRRLGRLLDAKEAFAAAAAADPENPWPRFDQGRAALALGPAVAQEAGAAFERAALLDCGESGARFWIWAARAALLAASPERVAQCRQEARTRDPEIGAALTRARDAALTDGDPEEVAEAQALLDALEQPTPRGRTRLPVVTQAAISVAAATPVRRTPRPAPPRPAHSRQRRSGGHQSGRRR